jgi:hypothetical protein
MNYLILAKSNEYQKDIYVDLAGLDGRTYLTKGYFINYELVMVRIGAKPS